MPISRLLLSLLDKFVIAYLYVSVLTVEARLFGIPANKLIIICSLVLYVFYCAVKGFSIPSDVLTYMQLSISMILMLAVIGMFKGNDFENVMHFVTPFLIFLTIPIFLDLVRIYSIERYLAHILAAVVLLSLFVCGIYFLSADNRAIGMLINDRFINFHVSYLPDIRIFTRTGMFYSFGILLTYYFCLKHGYAKVFLLFVPIVIALILSQTVIYYLSTAVSFFFFALLSGLRSNRSKFISIMLAVSFSMIVVVYFMNLPDSKSESIDIKREITISSLNLFAHQPLTGYGLGYLFKDMDSRGTNDIMLEVSYLTILTATGLMGSIFYAYILLYWPIYSIRYLATNKTICALLMGELSILIDGMANPYIFSGTSYLLIVLLCVSLVRVGGKVPTRLWATE